MRNWISFPVLFILESQPMEITYPSKWCTLYKWPLLGPVTLGLFQPFPVYANHKQPLVLQGSCQRGHLGTSLCMTSASRKKHPSYHIMPACLGHKRNGGNFEQWLSNGIGPAELFYKELKAKDTQNAEGYALFIRLSWCLFFKEK